MRSRHFLTIATAAACALTAPASANVTEAQPVLSHAALDTLENHIGLLGLIGLGLIGLLGLFGLRRRDDRA
jgi:LPXTG-motif cell wall-anchored protein